MQDVGQTLKGKYPAKSHARQVVEQMRETIPDLDGVLYLEGQRSKLIEDSDENIPFRQRRYFYYLSGCDLPDCTLVYDISADKLTLCIPPIDPDTVIWSGLPLSPAAAIDCYDIDDCTTVPNTNLVLSRASSKHTAFAIANQVSDETTFLGFKSTDFSLLKGAIEKCRVIKDDFEIALIRRANDISALAHLAVLKAVKHSHSEQELEAIFLEKCIANGCREQAYPAIVASGTAAATLHYQDNSKPLAGKLNLLLDAGGQYKCYASDILSTNFLQSLLITHCIQTRTFPINGTFSKESRDIYDIVLRMQTECIGMLRGEVYWDDVHLEAHKIAISGLLNLGILRGSEEAILKSRTSVAFFPHGLGHYLGLDTHDTGGGIKDGETDPLFRYLRVRGNIPARSVITVEPGIYFCRFIIEPFLNDPAHSPFINAEILEKYWEVGGVRIEDNILITQEGYENLTSVIKDVEDIEKFIDGRSGENGHREKK